MKKIVSLLLVIISVTAISGCSSSNKVDRFEDLFKNEVVGARNSIYTLTSDEINDIEKQMTKVDEYITKDSSKLLIILNLNALMEDLYYINEQYVLINVYNNMFPSNTEVYDEYKKVVTLQSSVFQCYNQSLVRLLDSKYKDEIFENWTEEEIKNLEDKKDTQDDEYYELQAKETQLQMDFEYSLYYEAYDDETEEIYIELVDVRNNIAVKNGYSNYLDYAYEQYYGREFEYADLAGFNSAIKNELIPTLIDMNKSLDKMNVSDYTIYDRINPNSTYEIYNDRSETDKLAEFIGGDYLKSYNYFWNEGEYYFGNDLSENAAFKTSSINDEVLIAYFGPGYYSNMHVFIHEFGHYAAGLQDAIDGSYDNLELAEFQAQSNEFLLSAYMYQNNINNSTYELATLEKLYDGLESIFITTMINEFEYKIYSSNTLTVESVKSMMKNVLVEYNALDYYNTITTSNLETFWYRRAGSNPCYYIAYAISLVPSIEMFFVALDDINETKTIYDTIMKGQNDLFPVLDDIGFNNPLTTNILSDISNKIDEMI